MCAQNTQAKKYRADTPVCPYGKAIRHKNTRTRKPTTYSSSSKRGGGPLAVEEMRKYKQRKSNSLPLRVLPLYYKKEGEFKTATKCRGAPMCAPENTQAKNSRADTPVCPYGKRQ